MAGNNPYLPPLVRRRALTTRAIGSWWRMHGRLAAPAAGLDWEVYEEGGLVGGTLAVATVEVYEDGVLAGGTDSVTAVEVYEDGVLVGGAP